MKPKKITMKGKVVGYFKNKIFFILDSWIEQFEDHKENIYFPREVGMLLFSKDCKSLRFYTDDVPHDVDLLHISQTCKFAYRGGDTLLCIPRGLGKKAIFNQK